MVTDRNNTEGLQLTGMDIKRECEDLGNHISNQSAKTLSEEQLYRRGFFSVHPEVLSYFHGKVLLTVFTFPFKDLIRRKECFSTVQRYLCAGL